MILRQAQDEATRSNLMLSLSKHQGGAVMILRQAQDEGGSVDLMLSLSKHLGGATP